MSSNVLAVSDSPDVLSKLQIIFEFINTELHAISDDEKSLTEAISHDEEYSIGLIKVSDTSKCTEIIAFLNKKVPALPLYLISENDNESAGWKGIRGQIEYPLSYRNLLSVMREVEHERQDTHNSASPSLTGSSPQLKEIQSLIRHVSMTDANVLILGESGTGKEVVARTVHNLSLRNDSPFVAVNCGAIPPDLLESELFGHEKGAFTGAISTRKGRFELAEGGTLFLDEIGDMPYPMQVKLLRVIQERTFERVGGTKSIKSDVRIIAATHQDLENKIGEGKFRMDLYYRLNVFPIELEPLRNRPDDISLLINEFSTKMELEHSSPIEFDESAIKALQSHQLPGNVRELENLVERLAILYPGETITNSKLPARYRLDQSKSSSEDESAVLSEPMSPIPVLSSDQEVIDLKQYLSNMEKTAIENALKESSWVVTKAAKMLSLQRTTLVEKIKKLDIQQSAEL